MGVADGVDDEPGQIDLFAFQRSPGVQARQQQHVLDEVGHPLGLGLHPAHRVRDVVGQLVLFALRQFGVAADRRQRGAQFVAGVGDELPHPRLAGLPGRQRAGDAVEHAVQRGAELADLGVRAGGIDLDDRRRKPHLTAVELEVGHLPGSGGNRCQRRELAPDDHDARRRRGDERDDADDAEDHQHPQQGVVDIGGRQADDDRLLRAAGVVAHHPVAAQTVEVDRRRIAIRRDLRQLCGRRGADPGPGAVGGDDTGVDRHALGDDGADHAGGLAGGVQEFRAGAVVLADDDAPRMIWPRRPERWHRAWVSAVRSPAAGGGPNVEDAPPSGGRPRSPARRADASESVAAQTRSRRRYRRTPARAGPPGSTSSRARSDQVRGDRIAGQQPRSVSARA